MGEGVVDIWSSHGVEGVEGVHPEFSRKYSGGAGGATWEFGLLPHPALPFFSSMSHPFKSALVVTTIFLFKVATAAITPET